MKSKTIRYRNRYLNFILLAILVCGIALLIADTGRLKQVESKTSEEIETSNSADQGHFSAVISPSPSPTPTLEPVKPQTNSFCLKVPVLMYHHIEPAEQAQKLGHGIRNVTPEMFDEQMKYLAGRGYRFLSAEELVSILTQHQTPPTPSVVVTIDDGYSDIYQYAFPIAKKYNAVLNLMIPTGLLENDGYFSWANLAEMVNSGLINAYDHTWSHYSLTQGTAEKIETEIMTGKKQLEEQLGKTVSILAYPYGSFNEQIIEVLRKNGFSGAFSTQPSFWQCESYIFALRRNPIGNAPLPSYGL